MANGRFSQPRNNRDEEREIERAFRQVTGQAEPTEPQTTVFDEENVDDFELLPEVEAMFYDEEPEEPEGSFLDKALDFITNNRRLVLAFLCALALVIVVGIIAAFFFSASTDPYDGKILNNVTVAGVNVGGMTRSEAKNAVKQATAQTYPKQDMVIQFGDTDTLRLSPADTGAELDVDAAVQAAYDYGRTGSQAEQRKAYENSLIGNHTIGLLPYLNLDDVYIREVLAEYQERLGGSFVASSYELEGDMPALDAENFDENAPCQTLVLTIGNPGMGVDTNDLYDRILDAYSLNQFLVTVDDVETESTPEPLDLEAICQEICLEPVEATMNMQNFETIPGSYGYSFDLKQAQRLLDNAQYGDVLRIEMEYVAPEILDEDMLFRDVLGACQTPHSNNANRTENLKLACASLNGLVLNPGEEFSYNKTLGERTAANGYKPAPAYSGYELVDSLGGGICQGSSTLYYCALLADLQIVERVNHGFPVSYIALGMDATVSWNGPDFRFKNNTNFPIKIQAEVSGGYVKMQILGTDERNYYVEMDYESSVRSPEVIYVDCDPDSGHYDGEVLEAGVDGYYVKSYKRKFDKETGQLLSRDFEANSSYTSKAETVARVVAKPTEETTVPTEPPATPPTEPQTPTETPTESPQPTEAQTATEGQTPVENQTSGDPIDPPVE